MPDLQACCTKVQTAQAARGTACDGKNLGSCLTVAQLLAPPIYWRLGQDRFILLLFSRAPWPVKQWVALG